MRNFKSLLRTVHAYSGAGLALIFIIMGLSGALLVFAPQIKQAAHPEVRRANIDIYAAADRIAEKYGDRVEAIVMPFDGYSAFEVPLKGDSPVMMSADGDIVARLKPTQSLTAALVELHFHWFAGRPGKYLNGVFAVLLVLFSASGLLLWPKRGFRWSAFAPKRFDPPAMHALHRNLGVVIAPFILLTAVTAVGLGFEGEVEKALDAMGGPKPPAAPPIEGEGPVGSLSAAMHIAEDVYPDARIVLVNPKDADGDYHIWMQNPGEIAAGATRVSIAAADGTVLERSDGRKARWSDKLMASFLPLHSGATGWPGHKIVAGLTGLLVAVLAGAGFASFWMRRLRARNKQNRASKSK